MKKGDTRGLSTVVTTLLIILLVIVAVAIVWGVIRNIVINNSKSISFGQFTIDLKIVSVKQNPHVDVSIKVRRNSGEGNLEGIIFSIFDGEDTHIYERHNVSLNQLETKTFVVNYTGKIVSVSIYPIFLTESGKATTGSISDTYYTLGEGDEEDIVSPDCVSNCTGKTCGDNGCNGLCEPGCLPSTPNCNVFGICTSEPVGSSGCTCATNTCIGTTCNDGNGESCFGALQPDCTDELGEIMCGPSQNEECNSILNVCGECDTENGWHCDQGTCCAEGYHSNPGQRGSCSKDCNPSDCGTRECGSIPGRPDCGETICGVTCPIDRPTCNITSGMCFKCEPNCAGKDCGEDGCGGQCGNCAIDFGPLFKCNQLNNLCEECQDDCGARECGAVPNSCGESCGNCTILHNISYNCNLNNFLCEMCVPNCDGRECGLDPVCDQSCGKCDELMGEWCDEGKCYSESILNSGTIFSVWPYPIGKIYFDSEYLPTLDVDYSGYYVKIKGGLYNVCFHILEFHLPDPYREPEDYSMSYMKVSTFSTDIEPGYSYEIWETIDGCNR